MATNRAYLAAVVYDNTIYAIGGQDDIYTGTCEGQSDQYQKELCTVCVCLCHVNLISCHPFSVHRYKWKLCAA